MRIITGTARGKRLVTPEGMDVRPTPEHVKEAIFSAIQFDIEGRRILDLFAGSGQLGLEALSRGAASAVFADSSRASLDIVKRNIEITGFTKQSSTVAMDYASFLSSTREVFDIAFLDPPYAAGLLVPALEKVASRMSEYGIIICEHPGNVELPEIAGGFAVSRSYRYGKIMVTVYRKESSEDE